MRKSQVVTIDGPAASGKTSVSRELANRRGWSWVSTGAFYRGLAYVALQEGVDLEDERALVELSKKESLWGVHMSPERTQFMYKGADVTSDIYSEEMGAAASQISRHKLLRESLLAAQRACADKTQGLVAEGRDCGTVVFPDAQVKIYLTAASESRAQRRVAEEGGDVESMKSAQEARDQQDSSRSAAPLQVPEGAHIVDTSDMDLQQVVEYIDSIIGDLPSSSEDS